MIGKQLVAEGRCPRNSIFDIINLGSRSSTHALDIGENFVEVVNMRRKIPAKDEDVLHINKTKQ